MTCSNVSLIRVVDLLYVRVLSGCIFACCPMSRISGVEGASDFEVLACVFSILLELLIVDYSVEQSTLNEQV